MLLLLLLIIFDVHLFVMSQKVFFGPLILFKFVCVHMLKGGHDVGMLASLREKSAVCFNGRIGILWVHLSQEPLNGLE